MAISCVYCGASHPDIAGVRECWRRTEHAGQLALDDPVAPVDTIAPETAAPETAAPEITAPEITELPAAPPAPPAGPRPAPVRTLGADAPVGPRPELGRNAVVRPGDPAPAGWRQAPRVTVTLHHLAEPAELIAELEIAAAARRPHVFELDDATADALAAPVAITAPPHRLGARHRIERSLLHHLVWSNSVDARDQGVPRWELLGRALELGGRVADGAAGDVVLPDGTAAWIDGGPVRFSSPIGGVPVIHRVALEHGSLTPFGGNETTAALAPDQLAAVTHDGGAARIIAPAGSGKTRVLTQRARHLLRQWRLPASAVCVVAFNKRAQEEIVERTRDLRGLQVRTLNSIALAVVNGSPPFAPRQAQVRTVDEGEVRRIIGSLVSFPRRRNADPVAVWIEALSLARLGLRDPADVESLYDGEVDGFADVYPRYRDALARQGAVDFDEQVQRAIEILLADPGARHAAQRACRVLLVDEFQDLTPAHLLLVRLLAGPDGAVFGVGDDDQTIYGYNGADPAWLIEFDRLFPGAGDHPLEVNYRCPGGIVRAADTLLRHNRRRVTKTIRSARPELDGFTIAPPGDAVATTVALVRDALAGGTPGADIAVLTRVNSLLAPVQVALGAEGIASSGGVGGEFAERTAVRAGLAWLRLATGGARLSSTDLAEALRRPSRPMHPNVATWVGEQRSVADLRRLADRVNAERDAQRIGEFAADIERLQRMAASRGTTAALLGALRDSMGLASTVASLDVHRRGMNRAAQNDDLTALAQLADLQPDPGAFEPWLRDALRRPWQPGGVTLATVHRVKGQEWPVVVVHQADDDQFPHRLADDVEEERRVFHVAITRASREVTVVPHDRPAPFIDDCSSEPRPERAPTPAHRPATRPAQSRSGAPGHELGADDAALFEELRALRRHLAAGKPAYTVLADAALHEIAVARPTTLAELARVKGIGPSKLEQYGTAILAVVEAAGSAG